MSQSDTLIARFRVPFSEFCLDFKLEVPARGVVALWGKSGSGKTTALRVLAGLQRSEKTLIRLRDTVWQDDKAGLYVPTHNRRLGYVFQQPRLFPNLDVKQNLAFALKHSPSPLSSAEQKKLLECLGIEDLLKRSVQRLSGGEAQRVGIARALFVRPEILLLDEPLSALDPERKQEMLPYFERLHKSLDIPVIYVSHALDEIMRLADRMVLLDKGQVRTSGPIAEVFTTLENAPYFADESSAIIEGTYHAGPDNYGLSSFSFAGGFLRVPSALTNTAQHKPTVRFLLKARDVSLTRAQPQATSILNVFSVRIVNHRINPSGTHTLVQLDAEGARMLASITRYSWDMLALKTGDQLWAQIKAVGIVG